MHLSGSGDFDGEHSEAEVRALWEQGALPHGTLYRHGVEEDWLPLATFLSAPSGHEALGPKAPPHYGPYTDPSTLTRILVTMLYVYLVTVSVLIVVDGMEFALLSGEEITEEAWDANLMRRDVAELIDGSAFLVTAIAFAMWLYNVNANCHAFGARGMRFSPTWSILCYGVPIVCIWWPFQSMREIWRVSSDPQRWRAVDGGVVVGFWWALWIVSGVADLIEASQEGDNFVIDVLREGALIRMGSGVIDALLCLAAIAVVRGIHRKQTKLMRDAA